MQAQEIPLEDKRRVSAYVLEYNENELLIDDHDDAPASHTPTGKIESFLRLFRHAFPEFKRHTTNAAQPGPATTWSRYIHPILPGYLTSHAYRLGSRKITPTSYLVGLRGWAAFMVVLRHFEQLHEFWILQQPFFRLIMAGELMVEIFFVVSGYVLAYSLVGCMQERESKPFVRKLAGAVARRYLRLYLPVGVATFIGMLCLYSGLKGPHKEQSFFRYLCDWLVDFIYVGNPFHPITTHWTGDVYTSHFVAPLWTIPVEFRGSLVVFLFCTGACMLTSRARITVCCAAMILCALWQASFATLFLAGVLFSELAVLRRRRTDQDAPRYAAVEAHSVDSEAAASQPTSRTPRTKAALSIAFSCLLVAIALFPNGSADDRAYPPWYDSVVSQYVPSWWTDEAKQPRWRLPPLLGSMLLVYALDRCEPLQRVFCTPFSQYLGEVSFGVYAMHPLIVKSLLDRVLNPWRMQAMHGASWVMILNLVIFLPLAYWAGDYFTRVDRSLVRFGHWLQKRYFVEWT